MKMKRYGRNKGTRGKIRGSEAQTQRKERTAAKTEFGSVDSTAWGDRNFKGDNEIMMALKSIRRGEEMKTN